MEDTIKKCNGDCLKCSMQQQIYCSAQMSNILMGKVTEMEKDIASMKSAMSEKQTDDVFNPFDTKEDSPKENTTA